MKLSESSFTVLPQARPPSVCFCLPHLKLITKPHSKWRPSRVHNCGERLRKPRMWWRRQKRGCMEVTNWISLTLCCLTVLLCWYHASCEYIDRRGRRRRRQNGILEEASTSSIRTHVNISLIACVVIMAAVASLVPDHMKTYLEYLPYFRTGISFVLFIESLQVLWSKRRTFKLFLQGEHK